MTRDEALTIKVGDQVHPAPLWNRSEGNRKRHLSLWVTVQDVSEARSQTGIMLTVRSIGGLPLTLDAGWFARA